MAHYLMVGNGFIPLKTVEKRIGKAK